MQRQLILALVLLMTAASVTGGCSRSEKPKAQPVKNVAKRQAELFLSEEAVRKGRKVRTIFSVIASDGKIIRRIKLEGRLRILGQLPKGRFLVLREDEPDRYSVAVLDALSGKLGEEHSYAGGVSSLRAEECGGRLFVGGHAGKPSVSYLLVFSGRDGAQLAKVPFPKKSLNPNVSVGPTDAGCLQGGLAIIGVYEAEDPFSTVASWERMYLFAASIDETEEFQPAFERRFSWGFLEEGLVGFMGSEDSPRLVALDRDSDRLGRFTTAVVMLDPAKGVVWRHEVKLDIQTRFVLLGRSQGKVLGLEIWHAPISGSAPWEYQKPRMSRLIVIDEGTGRRVSTLDLGAGYPGQIVLSESGKIFRFEDKKITELQLMDDEWSESSHSLHSTIGQVVPLRK